MTHHQSNNPITLTCPECGKNTDINQSWLEQNDSFKCACGYVSRLDDSQFLLSNTALGELSQFIAGPRSRIPKP